MGDFSVGSLVALAFGIPTHANTTSEWIVHAIKFGSALDRPCKSFYCTDESVNITRVGLYVGHKTDYAKMTEQDCLLGYKRVFNLTKSDAM